MNTIHDFEPEVKLDFDADNMAEPEGGDILYNGADDIADDQVPADEGPPGPMRPNRVGSVEELTEDQRERLELALKFAAAGFSILELEPGGKGPVKGLSWSLTRTRIPQEITDLFLAEPDMNYGINPGPRFAIIDLDSKPEVNGVAAFIQYVKDKEIDLPGTVHTRTAHNGWHLFFKVEEEVGNTNDLPDGVDIRGGQGYVVGAGCYVKPDKGRAGDGHYKLLKGSLDDIATCPAGILSALKKPAHRDPKAGDPVCVLDMPSNIIRAEGYVERQKPAIEGDHGNDKTYNVTCFVRDYGLSADMAHAVVLNSHWNREKCAPSWEFDELQTVVYSAWERAQNRPGCKSLVTDGGRPIAPIHEEPIEAVDYARWVDDGRPVEETDTAAPEGGTDPEDSEETPDDTPEPVKLAKDDRPLSGKEFAVAKFPRVPHLWDGLVLEGHPNSLDGDGGIGKTQALVQLGVAVASGKPLFGHGVIQMPVLLILCEDDRGEVKHRLTLACEYLDIELSDLGRLDAWCRPGEDSTLAVIADNGEWHEGTFYPHIETYLGELGRPCFLGLDTISDVTRMDENKRAPMNTFAKLVLGGWSKRFRTTSLVTRHPSKASMNDGSYYAGSTSANAAFRNRLLLKAQESGNARTLSVVKSNYGLSGSVDLFHTGAVLQSLGDMDQRQRVTTERDSVLEAVADIRAMGGTVVPSHGNGQKPKEIADRLKDKYGLDLKPKAVLAHLRALQMANKIYWRGSTGGKRNRAATYEIGPRPAEDKPETEKEE